MVVRVGCIFSNLLRARPTNTSNVSANVSKWSHRFYCASNSEHGEKDSHQIKAKILDLSLHHVPTLGWTEKALAEGVNELGYPSVAHGLFPRGGAELALHFFRQSNMKLTEQLAAEIAERVEKEQSKSTSQFMKYAISARVRMTTPHQKNWHQAMALLAHPNSAADSLYLLGQLVDDIWYLAGDKSHDMSWYSKRLSLAFIYKTSELYMLQDSSPDFEETWKFIDRRFEDISGLTSAVNHLQDLSSVLASGGYSAAKVLSNLIGAKPR